eukprot:GFUD01125632.1.p1 GENE.GFUD01125632.1~~GFUD01125632.1.p1  ORF type:complete len:186 (+),score=15.30 GFUD01125632.1:92-649(+)
MAPVKKSAHLRNRDNDLSERKFECPFYYDDSVCNKVKVFRFLKLHTRKDHGQSIALTCRINGCVWACCNGIKCLLHHFKTHDLTQLDTRPLNYGGYVSVQPLDETIPLELKWVRYPKEPKSTIEADYKHYPVCLRLLKPVLELSRKRNNVKSAEKKKNVRFFKRVEKLKKNSKVVNPFYASKTSN